MSLKDINGIELVVFGHTFRVDFWKDIATYDAEGRDGRVFVREQRHRFLPRWRRIIYHSTERENE